MDDDVRLLALYLPQFHPIPENDRFWGEGFTEWVTTRASQPTFSDHRQPRLPGPLGEYDLRDTTVQPRQEALAATHGVDAFVYYHYWFDGHRVMPAPLDHKLAEPALDLPFALCWANHSWNRLQNGLDPELLIEQTYSEADDRAHTAFLASVFADPRYLRWQGRPLFFMYRTQEHPDAARFADLLRAASIAAGAGDPYLVRFETNDSHDLDPAAHHFDAGADLHPHWLFHTADDHRPERLPLGRAGDQWFGYDAVAAASAARARPAWRRFPCVVPDWDTSARKPNGGANSLHHQTVIGYETWLTREVEQQRRAPGGGPRLVMLNAWNEWSECGYLEPDAEYGTALLEATARAKGLAVRGLPPVQEKEDDLKMYDLVIDPDAPGTTYGTLLRMVGRDQDVLEIGSGAGHLTEHLAANGNRVTAVDINPTAAARAARFATDALAIDLDHDVLTQHLRGRMFDVILMADVLEHLRQPQRVCTDLLTMLRPGGKVVVSVPHVGHADVRLMLLLGQWNYRPTGLLDDTHLRFFTRANLVRLLRDAGLEPAEWGRTERAPFHTNLGVRPEDVPSALLDALLADPDATTYQLIVSAVPAEGGAEAVAFTPPLPAVDLHTAAAGRELREELAATRAELDAYRNLRVLRLVRWPRRVYGAVLRRVRGMRRG